jgi:hypothetical protein
MRKHAMAIMATVVISGLPVSVAIAADQQGTHHLTRHHHAQAGSYVPDVEADPAVRGGYTMNGNFDWRRLRPGEKMPWYAHGYSNDCVAWTPHAYHYACDPNARY